MGMNLSLFLSFRSHKGLVTALQCLLQPNLKRLDIGALFHGCRLYGDVNSRWNCIIWQRLFYYYLAKGGRRGGQLDGHFLSPGIWAVAPFYSINSCPFAFPAISS